MKNLNPYLRYIAKTNNLPNKDFVMAYDCRFFFVLSGMGKFITEKGNYDLTENTLMYYPSGIKYNIKSDKNCPLNFITVNFDFTNNLDEIPRTLSPVNPLKFDPLKERPTHLDIKEPIFHKELTIKNAIFIKNDLLSLSEIFKENKNYSFNLCHAVLKCVILKIAIQLSTPKKLNPIVSNAINYIDNNYEKQINGKIIAKSLGYHPYYLSSLFKKHVDKTLTEYLLETRLNHALELLLYTNKSILEIALSCGFINGNHFSCRFKIVYGTSPSVWRKNNSII